MVNSRIILNDLKNHLILNYGKSIRDVILFGSRARGESKKYSDYDIVIVLDKEYTGKDENLILDLCYDIDLKYDILLDVHLISEKELDTIRGRQPIFINALKSGVYA
jgi:predicted nucleotidyltransferase